MFLLTQSIDNLKSIEVPYRPSSELSPDLSIAWSQAFFVLTMIIVLALITLSVCIAHFAKMIHHARRRQEIPKMKYALKTSLSALVLTILVACAYPAKQNYQIAYEDRLIEELGDIEIAQQFSTLERLRIVLFNEYFNGHY